MNTGPPQIDRQDQLTAEWFQAVLDAQGVDGTVSAVVSKPVGTGQMADSFRAHIEYTRRGPLAPDTLVVKLPAADPTSRRSGSTGGYAREVQFYTELASRVNIRVPRCLYSGLSPEHDSFTLVLEDLAPARQGDQIAGCDPAQAELALRNLAGLHGPLWCDPALSELAWLTSMTPENAAGLGGLLATGTGTFVERYADRLPAEDEEVIRRFAESAEPWLLARAERFAPMHGDYRLDNLLFATDAGGPEIATVDWQTISVANPGRDVAFFLGNAMEPADRCRHERQLVGAYLESLRAFGVSDYDEETCFDDYRSGHYQGLLVTVLGALSVERTSRGDEMFVVMAGRACAAIRELDCAALLAD